MGKPKYDAVAISQNITKCHENIRIFEEAITKEKNTISELEGYLNELNEN
jgi:hypothetical protein